MRERARDGFALLVVGAEQSHEAPRHGVALALALREALPRLGLPVVFSAESLDRFLRVAVVRATRSSCRRRGRSGWRRHMRSIGRQVDLKEASMMKRDIV